MIGDFYMVFAVETKNLTRKFGDFTAVDNLTMQIKKGEVCGFLGPNGAGKSTIIRMLCGILQPTSGSSSILGYNLLNNIEEIKRHIGYMSQKFSLYEDLTVVENLSFYAGLYSIPYQTRKQTIAQMVDMANLNGRENDPVSILSLGFKQRLALGCSIIANPSLLFLDEPTSGVSPTSRRDFFNIIQDLSNTGKTVIVTTHFMDEAERCDKIAFINEGKLLALDSPDTLKKNILQGTLVQLEMPDPLQHISRIKEISGVKECSLHGNVLHVLLANDSYINSVQQNTGILPQKITPNLEDVFITLTKIKKGIDVHEQ